MIRTFDIGDLIFLIESAGWTLILTGIAFVGAAIVGSAVAIASLSNNKTLRLGIGGFVIVFQGTPLLLQLFIIFFLPTEVGVTVSALTAAAIGLTLNGGAFLGEIWRGGLASIPKGQWEAAYSLGLPRMKQIVLIIAPQALRITTPATVGFLVQFLKATSLASIIGFTELTRAGQIIVNSTFQPFQVYAIISLVYFCLCLPLTLVSKRLEKRHFRR